MKFTPILASLFCLVATQANAQNFWIPAENFENHTNSALEGTLIMDSDFEDRTVLLLEDDAQVRIILGIDPELEDYIEANPNFQVCAFMANDVDGQTNTVIVKHTNFPKSETFTLENENYQNRCSDAGAINADRVLSSGLKVISPSQGAVKVRGISFRPVEETVEDNDDQLNADQLLANYEESRALGYLFGDGGITVDGESLFLRKTGFRISRHFESMASSFFGEALSTNSQDTRFKLAIEDVTPQDFLLNGPESVSDPKAFLTSIIETEGSLGGEVLDDPNFSRCEFVENLVNDLNPVCAADPLAPNCATTTKFFNRRNSPTGQFCTVQLTGQRSDWTSKFDTPDFNFVKCSRTPGLSDMCTEHPTDSRPSFDE